MTATVPPSTLQTALVLFDRTGLFKVCLTNSHWYQEQQTWVYQAVVGLGLSMVLKTSLNLKEFEHLVVRTGSESALIVRRPNGEYLAMVTSNPSHTYTAEEIYHLGHMSLIYGQLRLQVA